MSILNLKTIKKFIKKSCIVCKKYRLYTSTSVNNAKPRIIIFFEDGIGINYPGLVDRLKAIVGTYYIAKENQFDFKIVHSTSFLLEEYLLPNKIDWLSSKEEIEKSFKKIKMIDYDPFQPAPVLDKNTSQFHCYFHIGYSILEENHFSSWETIWHQQFWDLFKLSPRLNNLIEQNLPSNDFVSVHFRFVNALDKFEKGYKTNLSDAEKQSLLDKCFKLLQDIAANEISRKIMVFSDSALFIQLANKKGYSSLAAEAIGHVSFQTEKKVYDKTFLDFFIMSKSKCVYSIRGDYLYNSVFAKYAAIVGNVTYLERII